MARVPDARRRDEDPSRLGRDRCDCFRAACAARPTRRLGPRHGREPRRLPQRLIHGALVVTLLQARPRQIVSARADNHVDNSVQIGGGYVGFGIQPKVFIGDTRTHRYLKISNRGGWTRIDRRSLLVLFATGAKEPDAVAPICFLSLRHLPPIPACR